MSDLKSRVLSATAFDEDALQKRAIDVCVAAGIECNGAPAAGLMIGLRLAHERLAPFNELLGDALELHDRIEKWCEGDVTFLAMQLDIKALLTRANALLTKGDAK